MVYHHYVSEAYFYKIFPFIVSYIVARGFRYSMAFSTNSAGLWSAWNIFESGVSYSPVYKLNEVGLATSQATVLVQ